MNVDLIILGNMVVSIGLFIATLFRIKIEHDQVKIIIKNAQSAEKLRLIRETIMREKDLIITSSPEEIYDLFLNLLKEP